jgi:hypothetical protein
MFAETTVLNLHILRIQKYYLNLLATLHEVHLLMDYVMAVRYSQMISVNSPMASEAVLETHTCMFIHCYPNPFDVYENREHSTRYRFSTKLTE